MICAASARALLSNFYSFLLIRTFQAFRLRLYPYRTVDTPLSGLIQHTHWPSFEFYIKVQCRKIQIFRFKKDKSFDENHLEDSVKRIFYQSNDDLKILSKKAFNFIFVCEHKISKNKCSNQNHLQSKMFSLSCLVRFVCSHEACAFVISMAKMRRFLYSFYRKALKLLMSFNDNKKKFDCKIKS